MTYKQMQTVLEQLNKKWGLDFVSATSGNCCNTCGDYMTPADTKAWNDAETYLVVKWFFAGMNYDGEFEDQEKHYIKYSLGRLTLDEICNDLQEALEGHYTVIQPATTSNCIELVL